MEITLETIVFAALALFTTVSAVPGSVVDKVVYVENVGSGAFYTRVKITPEVVAANGELVPLTDRSCSRST